MRKGTKSSLYAAYAQLPEDTIFGNNKIDVVDGGYLLHKVVWHRNDSFGSICTKYVQYVQNHHGSNAVIVFDGYSADAAKKNTKTAERLRRSKKHTSADVLFDETMIAQVSQERFLANENNKFRLISMLTKQFEQANFLVKQAEEDADVLIVNTAISMCSTFDAVFIVGEDIDLLVLLTGLAPSQSNIYLRKPGRGKTAEKLYSANSLHHGKLAENILFLHAFSGCDTTSSLFNQGKTKFCSLAQKNSKVNDIIQIFKEQDADSENIAEAADRFLVALYGGDIEKETLDELRYQRFAKSITKSKFNLACLPPTSDAARYHAFRTYHQVQAWYGIQKNPQDWGWERSNRGLAPITMTKNPAPENLLNFISCKCQKGCNAACGCRKAGLKCSILCGFCNGQSCENIPEVLVDSEDEVETLSIEDQILKIEENKEIQTDTDGEDSQEDININIDINQPGPSKRQKVQNI